MLHEKGYARFDGDGEPNDTSWSRWFSSSRARSDKDKGPGDITLKPWGRVEGTLQVGDQPAAKQRVRLVFDDEVISNPRLSVSGPVPVDRYLYYQYETDTDDNGHFSFDRVRPGKARLCQYIKLSQGGMMSSWTDGATKPVEIVPGKTLTVELNGAEPSAFRERKLNETKRREQQVEAAETRRRRSGNSHRGGTEGLERQPAGFPGCSNRSRPGDIEELLNWQERESLGDGHP